MSQFSQCRILVTEVDANTGEIANMADWSRTSLGSNDIILFDGKIAGSGMQYNTVSPILLFTMMNSPST